MYFYLTPTRLSDFQSPCLNISLFLTVRDNCWSEGDLKIETFSALSCVCEAGSATYPLTIKLFCLAVILLVRRVVRHPERRSVAAASGKETEKD